jgi:membrane protein
VATALSSDEGSRLDLPRPRLRSRATLWTLVRETVRAADKDRVLGLAAEAGFWQLLSLPSLLLGVLGLIGFFGGVLGPDTVASVQNSVINAADHLVLPSAVHSTIAPALHRILERGRVDVVSTSFILSIWTGSSAMSDYVNTITIAYGMRHLRGAVRSRLLALRLYFGFVLINVVILPVMVLGPSRLVNLLPHRFQDTAHDIAAVTYWPLIVLICLALLATLYHLALPVRIPWRRALPGAMAAFLLWLSTSLLLRLWLEWSFRRESTYGPLASPIAVLLFLYLLALAVLIGAELNAEVDRMWPLAQTEDARRRDRSVALS